MRFKIAVIALLPLVAALATAPAPADPQGALAARLAAGGSVLGIFSGEHTAAQGEAMAAEANTDFVFYSLERGPFDIPTMQAYMGGLAAGAGEEAPHPVALRIPPIRDGAAVAARRVQEALAAGVEAVVFPHVENGAQAAQAVAACRYPPVGIRSSGPVRARRG